eukprot:2485379-Amphidinium_carterae.1
METLCGVLHHAPAFATASASANPLLSCIVDVEQLPEHWARLEASTDTQARVIFLPSQPSEGSPWKVKGADFVSPHPAEHSS